MMDESEKGWHTGKGKVKRQYSKKVMHCLLCHKYWCWLVVQTLRGTGVFFRNIRWNRHFDIRSEFLSTLIKKCSERTVEISFRLAALQPGSWELVQAVGTQEAKYKESWPNTTSAWAGWRRLYTPMDRSNGVDSQLLCTSSTPESPTYHEASQEENNYWAKYQKAERASTLCI